ncbi:MAG TPA: zf-HC2 domain-containing protein [Candidatus Hydrogenedentes bacterium]|nr:zf-HC2 domain-containing protein [Candidatus Hydrogenedentota bacterium]HNT86654.1 zf-HC2 domain-containing protein [Candidatus Hydrogenedentota bacterium]
MWKCRQVRALLAAAIYEPLGEGDRHLLDTHIEGCARCRALLASMRETVDAIPREDVRYEGDLAPALRARIDTLPTRSLAWRILPYPIAVAALAAALLLVVGVPLQIPKHPEIQQTHPVAGVSAARETARVENGEMIAALALDSPVAQAVCEADALIEKRAYAEAMRVLQEATTAHPDDPAAGTAQERLADIEFSHLRRYARAFDAYVKLRNQFPHTFRTSPESIDRFDLLVEGWPDSFNPLYTLDVARADGAEGFRALETLVAHHPGKLVASLALDEMQRVVDDPAAEGDLPHFAELEAVLARCNNPVAIAQVNLRLGDTYSRELRDPLRARGAYLEVAQSDHPVLAPLAQEALARLGQP